MDGQAFRETVEDGMETELDRLGSNKLLVALTDADLTTAAVLRVAAHSEHAARETFRAWAADEDDPLAREAFEDAAEREAEHLERVLDALDDPDFDPADGGPMHAYLREREGAVERVAAGMVGRGLVSVRTHGQVISFFVNEAEERRADLFRDLRAETRASLERGLDLLDALCDDEGDWKRARMVAEYVIQVAYDDYADALTDLGLDPRPIC
ncbi:MAG: rubrerythrin family protein [Haloferacaceae archaeon]